MENNQQNQESSITLDDLVRILKKNIILVAIITIVVFIIGTVYTLAIVKPTYKSTTSVIVAIDNESSSTDQNVDYTNSLKIIETVAAFTEEDIVLEPVAENNNLKVDSLKKMVSTSTSTTKYMFYISVTNTNSVTAGKLTNEIYKSLSNEIENNEAIKNFRITVSQASVAKDGVYNSPNKTLYLIVSLVIGFVLAFVVVCVKELLSNKYKDKKEIENSINEKIIGVFGNDKSKEKNQDSSTTLIKNEIAVVEPYNKLATNIKYLKLENPYKVLLVTSTVMDELKSTICCNFAYSLALNNKKVCVVDLDVRKPVVHKVFKVSKENGLVEYIQDAITKEELIKHTESGVDVITVGSNVINPLAVIEANKLKELVNELRNEYDYVLLDTAPVMAASDSLIAAKLADGVVYNIAINQAKKKDVQDSIASIKRLGNEIIGIVITKAYFEKSDSKYYNYYNSDNKNK